MSVEIKPKIIEIGQIGPCTLGSWTPEIALQIHNNLELKSWAPWLAASPESLVGRSNTFPDGQLFLKSPEGKLIASVSTNRIEWDGNADTLPNWDTVAGDPTTYENTYIPHGNTLALISMNVHPDYKKHGLPTTLVHQVQKVAKELGIEYIAGSFRPSEFGKYKATHGVVPFEEYIFQTREDGLPVDAWIRSLTRNGMIPLKIDTQAMTVPVDIQTFFELKTQYYPELWHEVSKNVWECGEVGQWTVNTVEGSAIYQESNLWGVLPGTLGYEKFKK